MTQWRAGLKDCWDEPLGESSTARKDLCCLKPIIFSFKTYFVSCTYDHGVHSGMNRAVRAAPRKSSTWASTSGGKGKTKQTLNTDGKMKATFRGVWLPWTLMGTACLLWDAGGKISGKSVKGGEKKGNKRIHRTLCLNTTRTVCRKGMS